MTCISRPHAATQCRSNLPIIFSTISRGQHVAWSNCVAGQCSLAHLIILFIWDYIQTEEGERREEKKTEIQTLKEQGEAVDSDRSGGTFVGSYRRRKKKEKRNKQKNKNTTYSYYFELHRSNCMCPAHHLFPVLITSHHEKYRITQNKKSESIEMSMSLFHIIFLI